MKTLSPAGLTLLKQFEGLALKPYLCSAGVATIGYGATSYANAQAVKLTDPPLSISQANELLAHTLIRYERAVSRTITHALTQSQFDAFVLLCYNCGVGAFSRPAQVAKWFNRGQVDLVEEWWPKSFITANGVVVRGLINRRHSELRVFKYGIYQR